MDVSDDRIGCTGMTFDRDRLVEAFGHLGADLASRGLFLEIAVCQESVLALQFSWRRGAEVVDAVLRPAHNDLALAPSVTRVAEIMELTGDWLNDAISMFTSSCDETLFHVSGNYPTHGTPGLRVLVATPHYLLAMKLLTLGDVNRGGRDMTDARTLAGGLGIDDVASLGTPYASIHGEKPAHDLRAPFPSVLG